MPRTVLPCILAAALMIAGTARGAELLRSIDKVEKRGDATKLYATIATLDCSSATPVTLNNTYHGDNSTVPNNVTYYGCSLWDESGGEVVFHLSLPTPKMFTASLTTDCDLDLAVLDACNEVDNCLIVVDAGVTTNTPVSGDFYLVVDGARGAGCAFDLTLTETQPVDFCALAVPLACAAQALNGDTCGGQNLVNIFYDCIGYVENGMEDYYAVTLLPGGSLTATVAFPASDAALYVFDDCMEPFNCLAASDNGDPEKVTYTNQSQVTQTVYLVVDSWSAGGTCGAYVGDFTCTPGTVAVEQARWSTIKTLYR